LHLRLCILKNSCLKSLRHERIGDLLHVSALDSSFFFVHCFFLSIYISYINIFFLFFLAAVCLLLASKVNDPKEFNYHQLLEVRNLLMSKEKKRCQCITRCSVQDLKQMVESCTHFVEPEPVTPAPVPTPITQQTKLKRRDHSSILAGPGYIVSPGEPIPVLYLQHQQQQLEENGTSTTAATASTNSTGSPPEPIRKLRMQPTFASLKAVAASELPISAADRNSAIVPDESAITDEMLLAEDSSSMFSPAVSTIGVGAPSSEGFGQSRRVSMSSSSTARDDGGLHRIGE
jgi:hypothetical protein